MSNEADKQVTPGRKFGIVAFTLIGTLIAIGVAIDIVLLNLGIDLPTRNDPEQIAIYMHEFRQVDAYIRDCIRLLILTALR